MGSLHPGSVELLSLASEAAETGEPTIEAARQAEVLRHRQFDLPPEDVREVRQLTVPGAERSVPTTVYVPNEDPVGILVHFHGGGWSIGSPQLVDPQVRALANRGKCIVVSVDYRLAPENPYPAGLEDAFTVTEWALGEASGLGGGSLPVVVGGASSGGNFAAAVALMARDRRLPALAGQLLVYPALARDADTESRRLPADQVLVTEDQLLWFWEHYLRGGGDPSHPYVSPLLVADTSGLPSAVILTAEFDVLRDEGEEYAHRLREAGVPTVLRRFEGLLHGFLSYARVIEPAGEAMEWLGGHLLQLFTQESKLQSRP